MTSRIECISAAPSSTFTPDWYDLASEDHFWFQWRFRILRKICIQTGLSFNDPLHVLDVGGGHGALRTQIEGTTAWSVDIADLSMAGLERCGPGRGRLLYYDVTNEHPEFTGAYDLALLMDVVEHIEKPIPFLRAVAGHLKPGGICLVNVPALDSCMSDYDIAAGHFRRYERSGLTRELEQSGLGVMDARYWGLSMVPLLLLRRALLAIGRGRLDIVRTGFAPPGATAHSILRAIMAWETALLDRPVLGTSVMAAARRNP